jgi:hypothetical protein
MGDGGNPIERSNPKGDSQLYRGCTILSRVPSAKKPVTTMMSSSMRGKTVLLGAIGSVDLTRLAAKNNVPVRRAVPSMSVNRDRIRAETRGMVNPKWAKIMISRGTANPQNTMRWAIPGFQSLRILFWPRRYPKSPAQSPERSSFRPIRQADHRLERPTNKTMRARDMRRISKAITKGSFPPPSQFPG